MSASLRLTDAQVAALQCRDLEEPEDRVLREAWDGGDRLTWDPAQTWELFAALTEHSNLEDADAEQNADPVLRGFARRAARSLMVVGNHVLRKGGAL